MRVHELAKELGIAAKEVSKILDTEEKKYKTMSGLNEEEINKVRKLLNTTNNNAAKVENNGTRADINKEKTSNIKTISANKKEVKKTEGVQQTPKTEVKKTEEKKSIDKKMEEKKQQHVSQLYFPQNSSKGGRDKNQNGDKNRSNDRNQNNDRNRFGDKNRSNERGQNNDRHQNRGNDNKFNRNNERNNEHNANSANRENGNYNNTRVNRNNKNGYQNDRNNNQNYRNGDKKNNYRNNHNDNNGGSNNNSYRNNDRRTNNGSNDKFNNNRNDRGNNFNQSGFKNDRNNQGRRNDRRDDRRDSVKDDFVFESKPDSRRSDWNKDKKNDRKKDLEVKENLKFASGQTKKPVKKEDKEEDTIKQLVLPDTLTIKELADKMKIQPSTVVKKLFLQGKVVTINQEIDYDIAEEIALEFNCICEHEVKVDVIAELLKEDEDPKESLMPRPPVVCVMGHVDHGKTSLLDAIRQTHVTDKEFGGITQKIGAYTVDVDGQSITFLDTPGHEAFTAMRMRGAQATDIAILVVAADDGVMPQTIEAINHAKAAGVEIIVAVNKIDKPNANIEKVKKELTAYELIAEDWGGTTTFCPVSAHTKEGIDELLEMILLTAEVNELKANPNRKARGIVIEAELDRGRGPVATILVQKGILKVGDNVAAGSSYGKIRAMIDDKGRRVKEAGPSTPVEILGLNDVPNAGEIIMAMDSDNEARNVAETFISEGKKKLLDDTKHKVSLDDIFEQIQAGNVKELGIIIKADVQGSVEAVKQSLVKLSNEEVVVKVIHGGVGNINESDVVLASASNAIIIGFNVKPDNQARIVAEHEKVDLRLYTVIYNAIEDVDSALKGMLEPIYEEKVIGTVEVRQIFKASSIGNIAGCLVTEGRVTKDSKVRVSREGKQIADAPVATLRHFKDDVKEVKAGTECGIVIENFNDVAEGDVMEAYIMVEVPR